MHLSTAEKWWRRWRETRTWAALPQARGPRRARRDGATFLRAEVQRQPDVTLPELCARVAEAKGVSASPSMMCRELRHLQLLRKKSLHDSQRNTSRVKRLRRALRQQIVPAAQAIAEHVKCIDESGVNLGRTRLLVYL